MTGNIRELLEEIEWIKLNKPPVIGAFRWVCPICKCDKGRPHHEKCQLGQALTLLKPCGTCGGSRKVLKKQFTVCDCIYCKVGSSCYCNQKIPCPDCPPAEKQSDFVAKINRLNIRDLAYSGRFLEDLIFESCTIIEGQAYLLKHTESHYKRAKQHIGKFIEVVTKAFELSENEAVMLSAMNGKHIIKKKVADLKAKLEAAEANVLAYRKMERRDYYECGKCGKDYHSLNFAPDCPFCDQALKESK
jgi:hypothetical protein